MRHRILIAIAGAWSLSAGCSLINSFDDVVTSSPDAGTGGTSGSGGTGASAGMAGSGMGGLAGDGGTGGSVGDGGTAGGGAAGEAGMGGAPSGGLTKGLIVVGGLSDTGDGVLEVFATNGESLDHEDLDSGVVAALAYDGAPERDLFFVFTSTEFPAPRDGSANLSVRRFDETNNEWIEVGFFTSLPPPDPRGLAVLNGRLAYLSHSVEGNMIEPSLTILDTSDPTDVRLVDFAPTPLGADQSRIGLLGTRGIAGNPSSTGGTLTSVIQSACAADVCELVVQPILVGTTIQEQLPRTLGSYQGRPAFAASQAERRNYYILPPARAGGLAIHSATPEAPQNAMIVDVGASHQLLGQAALIECSNLPAFTSTKEGSLTVASIQTGLARKVDLGHEGQLVAYEPFTGQVVTAFGPVNDGMGGAAGAAAVEEPKLSMFTTTANASQTSVSVAANDAFDPEIEFSPRVMVTRFPLPHECN